MSLTSKQSPLGINVLGSLLQNQGLNINTVATSYMGTSTNLSSYTFGSLCNSIPILGLITYSIRGAYIGNTNPDPTLQTVSNEVYNNLINIGVSSNMGAFGNSKPPTFIYTIPPGQYGMGPTFAPRGWGGSEWIAGNEATSWGFLRLIPFQAYNEFNYNNGLIASSANIPGTPGYLDFLSSFSSASGFAQTNNQTIIAVEKSSTFLKGTYSNMNDLITGDITGVNLATVEFGNDLINLGRAINLNKIKSFGIPSVLLLNLNENNALTQSVVLAILASGIEPSDLSQILDGNLVANIDQQRKLYGAFSLIVGNDLKDVLTPLNCITNSLNSLADLLDVKKIFPTSFQTLTVPVYNPASTQTNSKTYYFIYENGAISSKLTLPSVTNQFVTYFPDDIDYVQGTQANENLTEAQITQPNNVLNLQPIPSGFGSYLYGIIPTDMAIAAGAFSISMTQIKNIEKVEIEKFAQVVRNLETAKDLAINGTDVPVNSELQQAAKSILATSNGPDGSYTMSSFFGAMSGLPYNGPFDLLQREIPNLVTQNLLDIYRQIYIIATWEKAAGTVIVEKSAVLDPMSFPALYNYYFTITGIQITSYGGGYTTNVPYVYIVNDADPPFIATINSNVGLDPSDVNTYGRFYNLELVPGGLPIYYGSGTNPEPPPFDPDYLAYEPRIEFPLPPGSWPGLNTNLQTLIDQANQELALIRQQHPALSDIINAAWLEIGTQLNQELMARATCLQPPISEPIEGEDITPIGSYPTSQTSFVDSIYDWALNTEPHMYAQTLEAIANLSTIGGQSLVGLMREARNQARLSEIGIPMDNTIPDTLTNNRYAELIANGSIPPSTLRTALGQPNALGIYDPNTENYLIGNPGTPVPIGKPGYAGSLAGSDFTNLIAPQLNTLYTSNTLLSSTYTVQEAIDEVIRCNCDCWDSL